MVASSPTELRFLGDCCEFFRDKLAFSYRSDPQSRRHMQRQEVKFRWSCVSMLEFVKRYLCIEKRARIIIYELQLQIGDLRFLCFGVRDHRSACRRWLVFCRPSKHERARIISYT